MNEDLALFDSFANDWGSLLNNRFQFATSHEQFFNEAGKGILHIDLNLFDNRFVLAALCRNLFMTLLLMVFDLLENFLSTFKSLKFNVVGVDHLIVLN